MHANAVNVQDQVTAAHDSVPFQLNDPADPSAAFFLPFPLNISGKPDPGAVQLNRGRCLEHMTVVTDHAFESFPFFCG
jgi:hypothetical protein